MQKKDRFERVVKKYICYACIIWLDLICFCFPVKKFFEASQKVNKCKPFSSINISYVYTVAGISHSEFQFEIENWSKKKTTNNNRNMQDFEWQLNAIEAKTKLIRIFCLDVFSGWFFDFCSTWFIASSRRKERRKRSKYLNCFLCWRVDHIFLRCCVLIRAHRLVLLFFSRRSIVVAPFRHQLRHFMQNTHKRRCDTCSFWHTSSSSSSLLVPFCLLYFVTCKKVCNLLFARLVAGLWLLLFAQHSIRSMPEKKCERRSNSIWIRNIYGREKDSLFVIVFYCFWMFVLQ